MAFNWGGVAGGLIGGGLGFLGQQEANSASAEQAQHNRDFQLMMSNTAHVREVRDLVAAGLNPMLSAGAGAPTGAGSMPSFESALGKGVSSAMEGFRANNEREQLGANVDKTRSDVSVNTSLKALYDEQKEVAGQTAKKLGADAENTKVDTQLKKYLIPGAKIDSDMAVPDAVINRGSKIIDTVVPNAKSLFNIFREGAKPTNIKVGPRSKDYNF